MMLQIGLSDSSLQRELGAVRNPTLVAFNVKIEGFEQARRTVTSSAYGNAVSRGNPNSTSNRRTSGQGGWLYKVVQHCKDLHVMLSRSKFQVDTTLKFAGCVVSASGVTPDPDRLSALSNFPTPTDQTSVRSFLGLCNQLAFFVPDFQHHTISLRQLTGKGRTFLWLPKHQVEFDKFKSILSCYLVVRHFDQSKPIYLLTDASRLFGLGYALGHMEIDQSGKEVFKIVHCGSKGLTSTQQRYSTIELECLAIV